MKKRILLMTSILALAALASARVAQAQQKMIVDVPFAFVAGDANLPAGEYYVQASDRNSSIMLTCRDRGAAGIVLSNATEKLDPATKSVLIFNRYGDHYFLSQLWIEGNKRGRALPKSAREKESAQVASWEPRGQVTLVARLAPAQ
jgi:Tfp pilus assembly protein PilX